MSKIWFGNAEKMMWVNCPSTNIQRGRGKWESSGGFLNGGAYAKSSPMSHRKYSIDWNLMESYEAAKIMSFYEGVYGQSPIQFVDPFAAKSNILPLHWSTPRLCAGGEAPTIGASAPTLVDAPNDRGYPGQSAVFSLTGSSTPSVQIPVPPGKNLHFGARGSRTGTAAISVTSSKGNPVIARNLATNPSFEATSGTVEVRRNLVPNPSFEVDLSGWTVTGATLARTTTYPLMWGGLRAGSAIAQADATGSSSIMDMGQDSSMAIPVVEDQWIAVAALVATDSGVTVRSQVRFPGAATTTILGSPYVTATFYEGTRLVRAFQVPAGATAAQVGIRGYSGSAAPLPAGTRMWSDAFIAATAATEAEALAQVQAYFDGSTSPDPDLTPSWTGTAHASASVLTGVGVSGSIVASTTKAISSTQWASSGTRSVRTIPQNASVDTSVVVAGASGHLGQFEAGKTYTALVRMRLAAAQTGTLSPKARRIELYHNSVAGWAGAGSIFSDAAPNVAGEHEIRFTFTIPPDSVWASLRLVNGAALGGGDVWWDNFAIIEGEYTGPWFDGSNPPSGYESLWEGAANASTSIYRQRTTAVLSPLTETAQTTMVLDDPGTVTVKLTGSGALTLNSMTATIGNAPPKSGVFRQGEGNTGLKFVGEPTRTGYSSVMDLESVSAEFVETGAWE